MKNIFFLAAMILLSCGSMSAQDISADKVPAAVIAAFKAKFTMATSVKWEMEHSIGYEATFMSDAKKHAALFDKNGAWIETETEIGVSAMPQAVSASITSTYPAYKIKEAEKLDTPDKGVLYEAELTRGMETLEVRLSANGKILTSQKE